MPLPCCHDWSLIMIELKCDNERTNIAMDSEPSGELFRQLILSISCMLGTYSRVSKIDASQKYLLYELIVAILNAEVVCMKNEEKTSE